ncbi:MAG: hypothetical protein ICV69_12275 [Thermoleophilaceae bacterium]|nr:hypothetical protein [Thermoleophilaceae bacterium]
MADLERALRELAAAEPWPPVPDIAAGVGARLRAAPTVPPAPRRRRRQRTLAIAIAAIVALPAAALAFPAARDEVLERLGLRGVEVRRASQPPPARELLAEPDLGPRMSLGRARQRVGFAPLLPAALGRPDDVRVEGGRVSLVYRPRPTLPARRAERIGLLITEQRGGGVLAEKVIGPSTRVRSVTVDGARGAWIRGRPHAIVFKDERGRFRDDDLRLAGDTLVWEEAGLVHRIEGASSLHEALRIARSLR